MTTIETSELYPGVSLYAPQLVYKQWMEPSELSYNKDWFAQEKIDGYWETLVKENDKVYLFARSKSKTQGWYTQKVDHLPFLRDWALECLPNGTCLIGEVYMPGGTSKDVTTILGCKKEKAIERQEKGRLHYYIHDILKYGGKDFVAEGLTNDRRVSMLYDKIDIETELIPEIDIATYKDGVYMDFESVLDNIFERGGEGLVFKKKDALYLPGKRRREMFKIKQEANDLDLVVIDLISPERVYTGKELDTWKYWDGDVPVTKPYALGWKMGFVLGAYDNNGKLVEVCRCSSGLTDALREDTAKNPYKYIGNCVTIQGMSVDKKELSVRHPRFIGTHFDKPAQDCKLSDIFGA